MRFIPLSDEADLALSKFLNCKNKNITPHFHKQLEASNAVVCIIATDPPCPDRIDCGPIEHKLIINLYDAWSNYIKQGLAGNFLLSNMMEIFNEIGEKIIDDSIFPECLIRRSNFDSGKNRFYILLQGHEPYGLPELELRYLSYFWQIKKGFIPLHSSCVIHSDRIFLFLG